MAFSDERAFSSHSAQNNSSVQFYRVGALSEKGKPAETQAGFLCRIF